MFGFRFTVDKDLIVRSLCMMQDYEGGRSRSELVGLPYNHVFPKILEGDSDAVEKVMRECVPLTIKGYRTICFCGDIDVDIAINPIRGKGGEVVGAEVSAQSGAGCAFMSTLQRERRLIGIGKNSAKLAHGVRNPLNAIKGAVVYLKDKYVKEATLLEFTEIIEEEISKLDGFITKFLSNSLLEPEFSPVDMNELLRKVMAISMYQAYAKNISFVSEFTDLPLLKKADAFQLEHAIMNVINNSLEAMAQGGTISFKTEMVQNNKSDCICIEICDTGRGISQEGLKCAEGVEESCQKSKGRGFGLFITREIVQYHGGQLEIVSRKNQGTKVRIVIPVDFHEPEKEQSADVSDMKRTK